MKIPGIIFLLVVGFVTACSNSQNKTLVDASDADTTMVPRITQTYTRTITPTISNTPTPKLPAEFPTAARSATPFPKSQVCSPLSGIPLEELNNQVVNKFNPPEPGSDDPHQGIDYAILDQAYQIALPGHPVQATLNGKVVAVIEDRFPYGNAVMIETNLSQLNPTMINQLILPTPGPSLLPHPSLTCPETGLLTNIHSENRSLYLLYAHLQSPPAIRVGDNVECGDIIGAIGDSGNALNPHMHLEARIGPSGFLFPGLAHYETRAKPEEMEAYCIWRVSGFFQLLDPGLILMPPSNK